MKMLIINKLDPNLCNYLSYLESGNGNMIIKFQLAHRQPSDLRSIGIMRRITLQKDSESATWLTMDALQLIIHMMKILKANLDAKETIGMTKSDPINCRSISYFYLYDFETNSNNSYPMNKFINEGC